MSNQTTKSTSVRPKEQKVQSAPSQANQLQPEANTFGLATNQLAAHNGSMTGQAALLNRLHPPQRTAMVQRMARTHSNSQLTQIISRTRSTEPETDTDVDEFGPPQWLREKYNVGDAAEDAPPAENPSGTPSVQAKMAIDEPYHHETSLTTQQPSNQVIHRQAQDSTVSNNTRDDYHQAALGRAGIDDSQWDPSAGFYANQQTIKAVYNYYGTLYNMRPSQFLWSGMARVAGQQTFYPSFVLVAAGKEVLQLLSRIMDWINLPPGVADILESIAELLAELSLEDIRRLEHQLLIMQKQIFEDLAWQHEAFLDGGIQQMKALMQTGELDFRTYAAWKQIDAGNAGDGNMVLLRREQLDVIQDDYDVISQGLSETLTGPVAMEALSVLAVAPIPGGNNFREEVPDGDITKFEDRWAWVGNNMAPTWINIATDDPERAAELVNEPLDDSLFGALWGLIRRLS